MGLCGILSINTLMLVGILSMLQILIDLTVHKRKNRPWLVSSLQQCYWCSLLKSSCSWFSLPFLDKFIHFLKSSIHEYYLALFRVMPAFHSFYLSAKNLILARPDQFLDSFLDLKPSNESHNMFKWNVLGISLCWGKLTIIEWIFVKHSDLIHMVLLPRKTR